MSGTDIAAVRRAMEAEITGRTLCDLYERNATEHASRTALNWRAGGVWRTLSWWEYRDQVADVALGLRALGVGHGDFVALMLANRPEHVIADGGAMHAAATPVSIYNTLTSEQIAYIASDCGAKVAVVENRDFATRLEQVKADLPALEHVVLVEDAADYDGREWALSWEELISRGRAARAEQPEDFPAAWRELSPDDPATLIYTSGTTGPPKGVVITHHNVLWELASVERFIDLPTHLRGISYLPLAHVAERAFSHYLHLQKAGSVYFAPDPAEAIEVVQAARPQAFLAVPRVWEKIQSRLLATVEAEPNERKRGIALAAFRAGREAVRCEQAGRPVPLGLRLRRLLFERLVYAKIRERLGLDQCEIAISGAAPLAPDLIEFFAGLGLPIHEAYGMTETTAVTNANRPGRLRIGTVGEAIPGVEVSLADDGEVLARGGNIMAGYYNDEDATLAAVDEEGWLHTGDLGAIDADGYLSITGRKKEILITAGGKNLSPNNIEAAIKQHPLIGQVCALGDQRRFVSALIVLDAESAPEWAARNGIDYSDIASFAADERVVAEVQRAVDQANERLAQVEQVKRFAILPQEWTPESEELTPTMKLRRSVIHAKYADLIDELYRD